jgi:hypothetical protein
MEGFAEHEGHEDVIVNHEVRVTGNARARVTS